MISCFILQSLSFQKGLALFRLLIIIIITSIIYPNSYYPGPNYLIFILVSGTILDETKQPVATVLWLKIKNTVPETQPTQMVGLK